MPVVPRRNDLPAEIAQDIHNLVASFYAILPTVKRMAIQAETLTAKLERMAERGTKPES